MPDPQENDAASLMGQVREVIQGYRHALGKGEEVDLSGLDALVGKLSTFVLRLPQDEASNLQGELQGLVQDLDELERELKRQRDEVAAHLAHIDRKRQASMAYAKSDTLAKRPRDESDDNQS